MNYIKELNAFYDWLEINELTKPAVLLWHALMHLNNKSGWQESFTVARSVVEAKTGLKKDAYYKARNLLKQKGLLDYKERGNKATAFRMNSISSVLQTTNQTNIDEMSVKQTTKQTTGKTRGQTTNETINKLNKTKQNEKSSKSTPVQSFAFYQDNFGMLTPFVSESINQWIDDLSDDLVVEAMKIAVKNNKHNFKYCESILRNWQKKNVKTVWDAKREAESFKRNTQHKNNVTMFPGKGQRKENVPDWIANPQSTQTESVHVKGDKHNDDPNYQAKKRALEDRLKSFRAKGGSV